MFRAEQQIGNYTLVKKIGRGGFGEVWLAERRAKFVTTKVAVKLPLEEQIDTDLIRQEAGLWEQASGHPNVLPIIEADEYDGQVLIVSEYAPDGSLEDLLKKHGGALPVKQAVELATGILSGLDFLHSRRIIHRDIKPANILLQGETPRLADFGISRVMRTTSVSAVMSGTPSYMAPEAFDRKRNVQTDIWSVGVILYQMLKGSLPFPHNNITDLLGAIIKDEPERLPSSIPFSLERVVMKALAKSPVERYMNAGEMKEDLNRYLTSDSQRNIQVTQLSPEFDLIPQAAGFQINKTHYSDKTEVFQPLPSNISTVEEKQNTGNNKDLATHPVVTTSSSSSNISQYLKFIIPGVAVFLLTMVAGGIFLLNKFAFNSTTNNASTSVSVPDNKKLIPYRKGDKFGFVGENKSIVIQPKYDFVQRFFEGVAVFGIGKWKEGAFEGKFGVLDKNGNEIVSAKYDSITPFQKEFKGLAVIKSNGRFGLIDKTGKEVVPPTYDSMFTSEKFEGGLFSVSLDSKSGFINESGTVVVPLKYEDIGIFVGGLATAKLNNKVGYIDINGNEVIPFKYDEALNFTEDGLAVVGLDKGGYLDYGYIDKKGNVVVPIKYSNATSFFEGLAWVSEYTDAGNTVHSCIDINKKTVFKAQDYEPWRTFKNGFAIVEGSDKRVGFVDKTGKIIVPIKYDNASNFYEDVVAVNLNGKYGFIDKNGNVVIPFKYNFCADFEDGLAVVQNQGIIFYIAKDGTEYYEP